MLKLQMSNPLPEIEVKIPPAKPAFAQDIWAVSCFDCYCAKGDIFHLFSCAPLQNQSGAVVEWLACPTRNPKVVRSIPAMTTAL